MKTNSLILFFLLIFINCGYAQIDDINTQLLVNKFQDLSTNQNFDAIYLQTSKGAYETEEDLWFKGYVLDAQYLTPSLKSKTLFIQLIEDMTNQPVWEEKYEIKNGFVNGHLFLNDSLKAGTYTLVAYSSNSFFKGRKNFYAARKVRVFKEIKARIEQKLVKSDSIINFNVFPEGGNLVSGAPNKVAFKAVNSKGLPIDFSGILYENGLPKLNFFSVHAGMGYFVFSPDINKQYNIKLNPPYDKLTYSLPEILNKEKTLQLIRNNKDHLTFRVFRSISEKKESIYLRVQVRGLVQTIVQGNLDRALNIKIPLKDFPQGIAEVTLFDENLIPVAERLVYVKKEQKLNISTTLDKSEYNTREKATLKIKVTDENDRPVVAHLGLSIYDWLYQNSQDTKNILSHYYLSLELKGNIYNPAYYFSEDSEVTKESLDLLMLTQGWRRYFWNEKNLDKLPNRVRILSDSLIGYIKQKRQTKKVNYKEKFVLAFAADSLNGNDYIVTDSKGKFSVYDKHFKIGEKGYVYLKPMTPAKPKYIIQINDSFFDTIDTNRKQMMLKYPLSMPRELPQKETLLPFTVSDKVNKLEAVVLTKKKRRVFRDKYIGTLDSLAKFLSPDYIGSCGKLNCVVHDKDKQRPVEGETYSEWISNRKPHGHIGWYRKDEYEIREYHYPKYTEADLLEKFNLRMLRGYYGEREFYQPTYDNQNINDTFPDYRNTLYWKSDIVTNLKGEASVSFFCSDINTKFNGQIEGVGGYGLLGNQKFEFFVRKRN